MASPSGKDPPVYSLRTQTALLKAVGVFAAGTTSTELRPLERNAENLDKLTTGRLLGRILESLDHDFDSSQLELGHSPVSSTTSKRNVLLIYKGLFRYIRRHVAELSCQANSFDRAAITDNFDQQSPSRSQGGPSPILLQPCFHLLAVMVSAAALGPKGPTYVPLFANQAIFDKQMQSEIMEVISGMQAAAKQAAEGSTFDNGAIEDAAEYRDMDLFMEEQNASLRQELDLARKSISDYITRLEHLQMSHDELKHQKELADRELEAIRKDAQDGSNSAKTIKHLQDKIHEHNELLSQYEDEIRAHEHEKNLLEAEVRKWEQRGKEAEALRDEVAVWKHSAEDFEKKANMAERYKQKLESQKEYVKEVQNLQYEKAELQEQLRLRTEERDRSERARQGELELQKMMEQSEQHLWDERHRKEQIAKELAAYREEIDRLTAQGSQNEHVIQELQEQLQQGGFGNLQDDSNDAHARFMNLADELDDNAFDEGQGRITLEVSRLKAEVNVLKGSVDEATRLRQNLQEEKEQRGQLQHKYNSNYEKLVILQSQMDAFGSDEYREGSEAFIALQSQWRDASDALEAMRKELDVLNTRVADGDREMAELRSRLAATEKGGVEAVNDLRSADQMMSKSYKAELQTKRQEYNFVVSERDNLQSQLVNAFLQINDLRKLVEGQPGDSARIPEPDVPGTVKKEAEKMEKIRDRLKERGQQLEKSQQEVVELRRKLKAAEGGEAALAQKAAYERTIQNLQRVNTLLTTAWYDQGSRLQSNHVILQRRPATPKSWLNKSRQMVNATPRK